MTAETLEIVIVDDSSEDRATMRRLLLQGSASRYRFTEAETGAAAIAACTQAAGGPPVCVILDYYLPDLDAGEVLSALRRDGPLTVCPVVVITGTATPQCGPEVLRAGAQDYLNKAWMNAEVLTRAVDNAIERHRLAEQAQAAQAALQQSEEWLRLALQGSATGLWTWDCQADTITYSSQWCCFDGLAEADLPLTGKALLALIEPSDAERVQAAVHAAIADGSLYECEFRIPRPDGKSLWVATLGRATYSADRCQVRLSGSVTDVSRRKGAEKALQEANRHKDEFLATLAHELRNPLAPLSTGLALLAQAAPGDDTSRPRAMMERQLGSMVRLIDDLLDVSRINSGKLELVRKRIELRQVVQVALETSQPLLDAAGHTIRMRLPEGPLWIDGDLTRLGQVLSNLLNNAAKYTPSGGCVELTAESSADELVIRVTDNGIGIPREMLSRVFDMFTQVDQSRTRARGGLGIGLSLVRTLVELHGGQVAAQSAGPGLGSTFLVRLPLAAAPREDGQDAGEARVTELGPPRQVLVIDDNVDAAEGLSDLLRCFGHQARAVYSGTEALTAAREFQPDMIFLDIGLPDLDGYHVARQLRAEPSLAGVLLVALTGWGDEDDRRQSHAAGFDYHMTKPVNLNAIELLVSGLGKVRSF
jgi:PAS domain S-box-containing protein